MSYEHKGRLPVTLVFDPIDPDGTDWFFFCYEDWLRQNETISSHEAVVVGGTIITDSTSLGTVVDEDGISHNAVFGVQVSVDEGSSSLTITHRVTTTTAGDVDIGRISIDHSIVVPVKTL